MERNVQEGTDGVKRELNEIIFREILRQGLGIIPNENEHWLTPAAIGYVIGRDQKTVQNWISALRKSGDLPPEHWLGGYFRLNEMISALQRLKEKPANDKKKPTKKGKR